MPIAVPMMPHSDSGVSKQRFSPNSSNRPAVAPNTPPFLPTSSPKTTTRSSLRISVRIASVIASIIVITLLPVLVSVAVMGVFSRAFTVPSEREMTDLGADAALRHQVVQLLPLLLQLRRQ